MTMQLLQFDRSGHTWVEVTPCTGRRSCTRVDLFWPPAAQIPYQGGTGTFYVRCHGACGEPGYFRLTDEKIKIVSKSRDVFYLLWEAHISNGSLHRTITSIVMFIFILLGDS